MKALFALISATAIVFLVSSASAASLYWDPGQTATQNTGGNGNWDTNETFWYNGATDIAWTNANGDDAYFSGSGGAVTLTNSIFAGDIFFTNATGNYTISDLTGAEVLTVAGVVDTGGTTDTISSPLSGTLTKNGDGTLILTTNNASLTSVTVNQGALQVATPSALGTGTITVTNNGSLELNPSAAITLANPFAISGTGVNGEGALRNLTGQTVTHTGLITFETTNVVLGGPSGVYDMEGGISTPSGVNANATFTGGDTFRISYNTTSKAVNLNAGSITIIGGQVNVEATSLTYSNLVVTGGGSFASSLSDASFGSAPSKFMANNVTLSNGAAIEESHTFTMNGNRGIYLGPGGGKLEDLTGGALMSIPGAISGPGTLTIVSSGKAGAGIKLTGNNTFTGTTTVNSGATLNVGGGGGGGTFGTASAANNGTLIIDRGGNFSYAGGISGSGSTTLTSENNGIVKLSGPLSVTGSLTIDGAGTINLSGANTYSANTLVQCQYFEVNNTSGSGTSSGTVTVGISTGGTFLGGTGIISGPVTIVAGNALQPGNVPTNSIGTLTINNSLTLQSGSSTVMNLNGASCSAVSGLTSITFGGSLTVTNLGGTPAGGQTYHLFNASAYSGTFDGGIALPTLPAGFSWNTGNLYVNGTISVATQNGILHPPVFSGNQIILSGTEGTAGGTYSVLSTTNLTIPVSQWTVVSTGNPIDSNGNFSYTNTITPNTPAEYFMIRQP